MKNLELLLIVLIMSTIGFLSYIIPKKLVNKINNKRSAINESLNMFILDCFKVTDHDKSIDEVYKK